MLEKNGKNNSDGSFDWKDAILDAGVLAGLTFFTALGGSTVVGIPTAQACIGAALSAAGQFFLTLAIKRGLREQSK